MPETIVVFAAHPDDEVLGCGGTLAKWSRQGKDIRVIFLADGISSRHTDQGIDDLELQRRRSAASKAAHIMGIHEPLYDMFPDNAMDTVPLLSITQRIEFYINQFQPSCVLTHHVGDVNIDHQRVHQATVTACRPQKNHPVKRLLFFEVASSTEWQIPGSAPHFAPNWFEDISDMLHAKLDAMAAYEEELRDWPHPRSLKAIQAQAEWRGATVGCQAAEAFILGRHIA